FQGPALFCAAVLLPIGSTTRPCAERRGEMFIRACRRKAILFWRMVGDRSAFPSGAFGVRRTLRPVTFAPDGVGSRSGYYLGWIQDSNTRSSSALSTPTNSPPTL